MGKFLSVRSKSSNNPYSPAHLCALSLVSTALVFGLLSTASAATPFRVQSPATLTDKDVQSEPGFPPYSKWRPISVTLKHPRLDLATLRAQANANETVPFWTENITSPLDGNTYTMSMVGSDPYHTSTNTNVTYVPIVLKLSFRHGATSDPTKPGCGDNVPVSTRFFGSSSIFFNPITVTSNGQSISGSQLIPAFQRANFWNYVSANGYNITLTASGAPKVVSYTAPPGSTTSNLILSCGRSTLYEIPINAFDMLLQKIIAKYATPNQLPIILTYNVVETSGGCCIIGYHNAIPVAAGTQTYAVGSYVAPGVFTNLQDTTVWSHEMGEWMDDPFVQANVTGGGADDLTPAWGDTGQVGGCQNNLEVGDPLTGVAQYGLTNGGFTYHFQDLAFHDWFYRTSSTGTGGVYSFQGIFTSTQGVCS